MGTSLECKAQAVSEEEIETSGYTEEEMEQHQEQMLEDLELDEIETVVEEILGKDVFSFRKFVSDLVSGEQMLDSETLLTFLRQLFYGELIFQKETLMQLFLLILIAAFLLNLGRVFEHGQISDTAFYIVYLVIFALLIKSFESMSFQVEEMMDSAVTFMKVLTPAYYLAIVTAQGGASAEGYYQIVLLTLFVVQWVMVKILLPAIRIYVLLGIVNWLSKEEFLSKMGELIKTVIEWTLRSMIAVVVGMQVLQRMISPAVDQLQRGLIGKAASALPGVGNAIDAVTEMVLGCAVLIRNCLGAASLITLLLLGAGPLIQLAATAFMYRVLAAVTQPVAEKRLVNTLTVVSDGFGLLLRVLLTTEVLFLVSIAIVSAGSM